MTERLAYTVQEAAAVCGVSVDVIRRAVRSKALPIKYPTARGLIQRSDLEAWLDAAPDERVTA